jgi:hypothetical protein
LSSEQNIRNQTSPSRTAEEEKLKNRDIPTNVKKNKKKNILKLDRVSGRKQFGSLIFTDGAGIEAKFRSGSSLTPARVVPEASPSN